VVKNQDQKMNKILYKDEVYAIQGAIFDVYREMGCGFLEPVYQECLEKELKLRGIPFESQIELRLRYKGGVLDLTYKPDLVCYGNIIVELKAVKEIDDVHRAQVFNYLKATSLRLGLLVNFGHYPKATVERIIM
jgi:GxxExxY protein